MSIVRLSTASMIHILEYMLEGEPRKLLESNDLLAPTISRMQKAREELIASRGDVKSPLSPEEERRLRMVLSELDQQHDHSCRSLFEILALAANTATTPDYQTTLTSLQEDLFPYGMQIVRMKWVDEAGEASRLNQQIKTKEVQDLLSGVAFTSQDTQTTALKLAQDIANIGQQMSTHLVQLTTSEGAGGPTVETQARRGFTKLLTRISALAELEWEEQPAHFQKVFKALHEQVDNLEPVGITPDKKAPAPVSTTPNTDNPTPTPE